MVLWDVPLWIALITLFVFGATIGSFLNVCIYRMPNACREPMSIPQEIAAAWKSLLHPPSRCGYCFHPIALRDNIPILGWFILRGRCRHCRRSYSVRYAGIELLNGLLFALLYWFEVPSGFYATVEQSCLYHELGPTGTGWLTPEWMLNLRFLYHLVLVEMLVVATFIDFDLRIIPDSITIPAMVVGVLGGVILGQAYIVPVWFERQDIVQVFGGGLEMLNLPVPQEWFRPSEGVLHGGVSVPGWISSAPHLHGLAVSLAGLLVGGGIILGVRIVGHWALKQEAMGFGDVTLMAAIGSFLGWQAVVMTFFLAPILALIVVALGFFFKRQREIPYGPYLSLAALLVILFWKQISPAPLRLFEMGRFLPILAIVMFGLLLVSLWLVQSIKKLLGIRDEEFLEEGKWTSADQLSYQASSKPELYLGEWERPRSPAPQTARGEWNRSHWRRGEQTLPKNGWHQHWQRRPGR